MRKRLETIIVSSDMPSNLYPLMTVIGWVLILFIHHRTLKKAEISRVKDNLVKKIESLHENIEQQIDQNKLPIEIEKYSAAKCAQILFYIDQFNYLVKRDVISSTKITDIYDLDFSQTGKKEIYVVHSLFYDFIEDIERCYTTNYLETSFLYDLWYSYKSIWLGLFFGSISLFLFIEAINHFL